MTTWCFVKVSINQRLELNFGHFCNTTVSLSPAIAHRAAVTFVRPGYSTVRTPDSDQAGSFEEGLVW